MNELMDVVILPQLASTLKSQASSFTLWYAYIGTEGPGGDPRVNFQLGRPGAKP
jgi:hypothetical protein